MKGQLRNEIKFLICLLNSINYTKVSTVSYMIYCVVLLNSLSWILSHVIPATTLQIWLESACTTKPGFKCFAFNFDIPINDKPLIDY